MRKIALIAVLVATACGRKQAAPYRTDPVTRGPVSEVVNATGDVSAIVTVNVGSQVSGIIDKLNVDFNSKVKKDQLLATLDPRLFQAQLEKAAASLASANANVEKAQVNVLLAENDLVNGRRGVASDVEVIPIQQINEAYDRAVKSEVRYRFVIDIASLNKD